MSRTYQITTIKKLFAQSGNYCAFPVCQTNMIDENLIFGEICHIEGENETSARYNPKMTPEQRNSLDNLILLCPTHHTLIDKNPSKYTTDYITKMKSEHESKNNTNRYEIPPNALKVINVSVNRDEYSLGRIYNLLKISKKLHGTETKKLWCDYFMYALKALKLSCPLPEDEKDVLKLLFDDIISLDSEDVLLEFLNAIPNEISLGFIQEIKPNIETLIGEDFANPNLPRLYKLLKKSDTETLTYLINNADNFDAKTFDTFFCNINVDLQMLAICKC